jgi:heme-degrading monooxygenase HmoA
VGAPEARVSVVSVLRLSVREDAGPELERLYEELSIFDRARESGGFSGGRLLRPLDDGPYLVVAEWDNARAYQRWLDNPVRADLGQHIEPLLAGDVPVGELFEEV